MPTYSCIYCNIHTSLAANYKRHLKTKKHIKNITIATNNKKKEYNSLINDHKMTTTLTTNDHKMTTNCEKGINIHKQFRCDYCERILSTKGHLRRHQKLYCKKIKTNDENKLLKSMIKEQQKSFDTERKTLYKHIETLLEKVGNTTIHNNHSQTNNIQLNSYGKEDLSHITDELKTKFLKFPYGMIPKMIEAVHFSDKKPENKNIALTNKKENKIKIYTGNKWIYRDKDETINDLMDGKYFLLDSYYEAKSNDSMNIQEVSNYIKFREFFDDNDKKLIDDLKKECELVLLNNR